MNQLIDLSMIPNLTVSMYHHNHHMDRVAIPVATYMLKLIQTTT